MEEPAHDGIVDAGLVVVEVCLRQRDLTSVFEPGAVPHPRLPVGPVRVDRSGPGGIGRRHNRSPLIPVQPGAGPETRPLVPDDGFVGAGAVHITAEDRIGRGQLHRQPRSVVEKPRGRGSRDRLVQPPGRVVGQRQRGDASRLREEMVLDVIGERPGAVGRQVAAPVVAVGRPGDAGIPVQAVRHVGASRRDRKGHVEGIIDVAGLELARERVAERGRDVLGRPGEVVSQGAHTGRQVVVGVRRRGSVTAGDRRTPRERVVIVDGENSGAGRGPVLPNLVNPVQRVVVVVDERVVRPSELGPIAVTVVAVGENLPERLLRLQPAGGVVGVVNATARRADVMRVGRPIGGIVPGVHVTSSGIGQVLRGLSVHRVVVKRDRLPVAAPEGFPVAVRVVRKRLVVGATRRAGSQRRRGVGQLRQPIKPIVV